MTGPQALAAAHCIAGLCEPESAWSCGPESMPNTDASFIDLNVPIVDLLQPDAPLEVRVCNELDVACEAPLQISSHVGPGDLSLRLESGFAGYLQVTRADIVPTAYFLAPGAAAGGSLPALRLMSPAQLSALAAELNVQLMPERGLSLFSISGCDGTLAAGVALEAIDEDADMRRFYAGDGPPSSAAEATGSDGFGGFLNARVGAFSVVARLPGSDAVLAAASVLIRAGSLSIGHLSPIAREAVAVAPAAVPEVP